MRIAEIMTRYVHTVPSTVRIHRKLPITFVGVLATVALPLPTLVAHAVVEARYTRGLRSLTKAKDGPALATASFSVTYGIRFD